LNDGRYVLLLYFVFRAILVKGKYIIINSFQFLDSILYSILIRCVCVFLSFDFLCSVWYVNEWTRSRCSNIYMTYFYLSFLSTNNQRFLKLHVYLFSFCPVYWTICLWCSGVKVNLIRFCSRQKMLCDVYLCNFKLNS
jgi:hypothetical protein